jgi:energy-coupling factor transporter ATP-binding protein EcfA2
LVDRMIVMDQGSILADGVPSKILGDERITDVGVGIPPIAKLVQGLRRHGVPFDEVPLTVKEGRAKFGALFKDLQPVCSSNGAHAKGKPRVGVERLWYTYPDGPTALRDVSLEISSGEFVAIMGRNASGKTTLVKHINGLVKPTKGKVKLDGRDTKGATVAQMARRVGFVFQNPNDHLFADTVEDECVFTLKNLGYKGDEVKAKIDETLETFGLARYRREYPRSLSGGERQRVALASVLVARPEVLILDEPTRGMEDRLKRDLMAFLDGYRKGGNTVIIVTHDVEMAAEHADRVILMSEGRVVVDGSRREVLSQALLFSPQINRLVQSFEKYGVPVDTLTADEALGLLDGEWRLQ